MGFVWSDMTEEPTLADADDMSHKVVVPTADNIETTISGLYDAGLFYVRAYMKMADGTTVLGAPYPCALSTKCCKHQCSSCSTSLTTMAH